MTSPVVALRVPITFRGADGTSVHAPLIAAAVAGLDTLLVLDTGSDAHLLTKETAERAGLTLQPGEEGTDHAGTTLPSWTAGDVPMNARGTELMLRNVVVIPAPAPFPAKGIGGILSPQHLDPRRRVVVDLVHDELLLVDGEAGDLAAWLALRAPELTTLTLERDGTTATPVVRAAVAPFDDTDVLLNTGGRATEFDETVVPGLDTGEPERLGGGVSGADVMGTVAGDQVLMAAGAKIPVATLAVRREMGYPPGLVGMNVLRGTVLAVDANPAGLVTWQVSG